MRVRPDHVAHIPNPSAEARGALSVRVTVPAAEVETLPDGTHELWSLSEPDIAVLVAVLGGHVVAAWADAPGDEPCTVRRHRGKLMDGSPGYVFDATFDGYAEDVIGPPRPTWRRLAWVGFSVAVAVAVLVLALAR